MNKKDNTFSTTGSVSEGREEAKVTDEKMLTLLKLVYYERKSIKQSSKYLKINYNSAKRIVKNFRKKKIVIEDPEKLENLVDDLKMKPEPPKKANQIKVQDLITNQIRQFDSQILTLNEEIRQNQLMMVYLTNFAQGVLNLVGKRYI